MSTVTNPEVAVLVQNARREMAYGHYEQAVSFLQEAAQKQPTCAEVYTLLGICYAQLRRDAEALQAFQRATALDMGNAATHYNYAVILDRVGHTYEALEELKEALKLDPHHRQAEKLLDEIRQRFDLYHKQDWER